jgi:hypothetical protein
VASLVKAVAANRRDMSLTLWSKSFHLLCCEVSGSDMGGLADHLWCETLTKITGFAAAHVIQAYQSSKNTSLGAYIDGALVAVLQGLVFFVYR